jgi:RNA 2',3'-cyclic 3'-phosphodiesterase
MRLFTGIDLPAPVRTRLDEVLTALTPTAAINWSPLANLHITTKFIGQWPDSDVARLENALASLPRRDAFDIRIGGLGWFPNPHSPRVFWAGIDGGDALRNLARDTEKALADLGIEPESKAYSPHLTLARIKSPVPLVKLRQAVAQLPSSEFGQFTAERFLLYRSVTSPKGSTYSVLAEFPL